jgi:Recombination endonuclease VII
MSFDRAAYMRQYRLDHPAETKRDQDRYRNANRELVNQMQRDRYDPVKGRAATKRSYHGRDIDEDFPRMWEEQDGCCYLCGREMTLESHQPTSVCIDHDHKGCHPKKGYSCRECRRGLACDRCNRLIGMVGDDVETLRTIAANLEEVMKNG